MVSVVFFDHHLTDNSVRFSAIPLATIELMFNLCYHRQSFRNHKDNPMSQQASARHILLKTETECTALKKDIEGGKDFAVAAKEKSLCPSGKKGGALGTFAQGKMVPEFDQVVFNAEIGKLHGPVKTTFGYHLIEVTERT